MKIKYHKIFTNKFGKLKIKVREKAKERLIIFFDDPFNERLNNHALQGKYIGFRSINISGDLRAIYKMINNDTVFFIDLDTHSNLYS
ncbi:type II toxin-antitoxin system mRNA interferase toxin, RelE/StbE family [Patescibacteria group bacterium]|nr:type II toxin-antitoxin system mRNA interferase toxin, RelE/StbE family [Patescibacteria group bacterium]